MKKLMGFIEFVLPIITCFGLLIGYCVFMLNWSENKKEECIKNGGTVIDTYSVYDSCIYGG